MSTALILLFELFITQKKLIRFLRMDIMILLAIVIILRLFLPFEYAFTITIPFPWVMNYVRDFLKFEIYASFTVLNLLCLIWCIGIIVQFIRYIQNIKKCNLIFCILKSRSIHKCVGDYIETSPKYNYSVWFTDEIDSPMVIGLKKVIFLPIMEFKDSEIQDIIKHETQHIKNHDNWIKQVVNLIKIIYWWFPPVYWFSKKIQLALEMRVDQQVTKNYSKTQLVCYTNVLIILKKFMIENSHTIANTLPVSSSFFIGDDENVLSYRINYLLNSNYRKNTNWLLLFLILLLPFTTNSIVFEAYTPPPIDNYTTKPADSVKESFILKHADGTYSLFIEGKFEKIDDINDELYSNLPIINETED
ncbi:M56 family metallopeptidase [Floccifex sp.]|uniref:M56 family metallopeptidase n=1 Tax=Floccifex sp. TaxID=2815810 RepID=UPI003F0D6F5E